MNWFADPVAKVWTAESDDDDLSGALEICEFKTGRTNITSLGVNQNFSFINKKTALGF